MANILALTATTVSFFIGDPRAITIRLHAKPAKPLAVLLIVLNSKQTNL